MVPFLCMTRMVLLDYCEACLQVFFSLWELKCNIYRGLYKWESLCTFKTTWLSSLLTKPLWRPFKFKSIIEGKVGSDGIWIPHAHGQTWKAKTCPCLREWQSVPAAHSFFPEASQDSSSWQWLASSSSPALATLQMPTTGVYQPQDMASQGWLGNLV